MSKKITFAVTIEDDHDLVSQLKEKIASSDCVVEIIGLGGESDLEKMYSVYEKITGFDRLPISLMLGHILIFSVDAFFELEFLLPKSESLTIWSDPEFHDAELKRYLIEAMVESCPSGVVARTRMGRKVWKEQYGLDVPVLSAVFSGVDLQGAVPLIEKTGRTRLLLDGGRDVINNHLIESFLQLDKHDVDIWCVYPERLKPWMAPDMYFTDIPREEIAIFYQAVDGVVIADRNVSEQKVMDYVLSGFMPIVSTSQIGERISTFFDGEVEFFVITGEGLGDVLKDPKLLAEYNKASSVVLKSHVSFSMAVIEITSMPVNEILASKSRLAVRLAQKEFFRVKYNDEEGSAVHRGRRGVVCTVEGGAGVYGVTDGWGVDVDTWEQAYPIIKYNNERVGVFLEKTSRPDVLKVFPGEGRGDEVGFVGCFILNEESAKMEAFEIINRVDSSKTYSTFNHTGMGFKSNEVLEGYHMTDAIKGSLDSFNLRDALVFDLSGLAFGDESKESRARVILNGVVLSLTDVVPVVLGGEEFEGKRVSIDVERDSLLFDRALLSAIRVGGLKFLVLSGISFDTYEKPPILEVIFLTEE